MPRYVQQDCAVFCRVRDAHGVLSNMANGFPLWVDGWRFSGSEAVYQACKFPHAPDVMRRIAEAATGMDAKRVARESGAHPHRQWNEVRVDVMRWVLELKYLQYTPRMTEALAATEGRPIVELSVRDPFWGARPVGDGVLEGENQLGRLWEAVRAHPPVAPLPRPACVAPFPRERVLVLVCGGRDYADAEAVAEALERALAKYPQLTVLEGGARGADALARDWAHRRGVPVETVPAEWARHGAAAGPLRNQAMLDRRPNGVIAFPGGRGTAHMIDIARQAGVPVWQPEG